VIYAYDPVAHSDANDAAERRNLLYGIISPLGLGGMGEVASAI
jgi:hypothetical protein